ncbi:hypothetical protein [Saccharopolyspora sp. 7B]|uniref:hypothetical protein n=1 Tax=Saccharopolyspora sp. 7B TaxID=2877240 RepID=UPI001CD4A5CE|nr:hypothetical protein [Saccharopolyspora sp. 7B]MCA1281254.1 hypothetical protein [Saccharopolyspora sp. 7B]
MPTGQFRRSPKSILNSPERLRRVGAAPPEPGAIARMTPRASRLARVPAAALKAIDTSTATIAAATSSGSTG